MTSREETMVDERLDALERWQSEMDRRFAEAFPGGDHVGHCRYHELMIEQISDRKRLIAAIKEKTISALVWSAVVAAGAALWYWFKAQVRGGS